MATYGKHTQSSQNFYWISWYDPAYGHWELHWPWWITGEEAHGNNPRKTVCAAIAAHSENDAYQMILDSYDDPKDLARLEFRFCEPKGRDWTPYDSDRFLRAKWMPDWPAKAVVMPKALSAPEEKPIDYSQLLADRDPMDKSQFEGVWPTLERLRFPKQSPAHPYPWIVYGRSSHIVRNFLEANYDCDLKEFASKLRAAVLTEDLVMRSIDIVTHPQSLRNYTNGTCFMLSSDLARMSREVLAMLDELKTRGFRIVELAEAQRLSTED